ncbi:hypothetical protein [Longimicrobium sp.]|uniref:hypothetical protein n=1 Tax=Longimicrobium sp. TaxID=2029185 RepID=UPI002C9ABAA6|nr:hypothetical protein [Longimicrobium sp.]HSU14158.1 hypothetical protein [Longimicrobium sp.]
MSTPTSMFTTLLALSSALGLALTPGCENRVDFEAPAVGEEVGRQYLEAPGVEFLTAVNCAGGPACVPVSERWRGRCEALPRVIAEAGALSGSKVADIRHGQPEFAVNAVCARLVRPAWRLLLHVRNAPGRAQSEVTLVALDAAGTEIGRSVQTVLPGTGFTPLEVQVADDRISSFVLWGMRDAGLAIDDLTFFEHT